MGTMIAVMEEWTGVMRKDVVSQFIFFACGQYSGIFSCFSVK